MQFGGARCGGLVSPIEFFKAVFKAMNVIREIDRINQLELDSGIKGSWHDAYKHSAYVYVGGLPFQLTEGDVLCVFSQYGNPSYFSVIIPYAHDSGTVI
jgi:RNA recognition motif-containing protein